LPCNASAATHGIDDVHPRSERSYTRAVSPVRAPRIRRWCRRGLAALACLITVMLVALTLAMFMNDSRIQAEPVRATGTVLDVSALRTGIEFVDQQGLTIRPSAGVLYPGLLRVGQQFVVEYAASQPEIVRVAGRSAWNGLLMVAIATLGTWLVATPLLIALNHPSRRLGRYQRTVG